MKTLTGLFAVLALLLAAAAPARADLWEDQTAICIGTTAEWSNKVELADLDGDGWVDIIFANGGAYASPGDPEPSRVFHNTGVWDGGEQRFVDITEQVFGNATGHTRVVKARDVDGDGHLDLFVGNTYQTQSRLFLADGRGGFTDVTATHLPHVTASVGDAEFGDVDGDGDLDLVLADWGNGNPFEISGQTRLWLNDGTATFADATATLPVALVGFSWDLELVDIDNDYDLDLLVSSKTSAGSFLFANDGAGGFTDHSDALPQFTNNYELEPMDVDGDGFLDLVTINDGPALGEHLFINLQDGTFADGNAEHWPAQENLGEDDNVITFLDADSDGDADFLIGSLSGADRLMRNDGAGNLTVETDVMPTAATPGTLGLAVADLDHDGRLDVVQSQGEVADPDAVLLGVDVPPDTAPPVVELVEALGVEQVGGFTVRARVHDRKSPTLAHDWQSVRLEWQRGDDIGAVELRWYGEYLWTGRVEGHGAGDYTYRVHAVDAAGNETTSAPQMVTVTAPVLEDAGVGADAAPEADAGAGADAGGGDDDDDDDGGCCRTGGGGDGDGPGMILLAIAVLAVVSQRRRAH